MAASTLAARSLTVTLVMLQWGILRPCISAACSLARIRANRQLGSALHIRSMQHVAWLELENSSHAASSVELFSESSGGASFLTEANGPHGVESNMVKKKLTEALAEKYTAHGGPANFVRAMYPDEVSQNNYAAWLLSVFPESDDALYQHDREIPMCPFAECAMTTPVRLHCSTLGFDLSCSMKPYVGTEVGLQLVDQILMDGFLTSADPLFIIQPSELLTSTLRPLWRADSHNGSPLLPFSIGYTKGTTKCLPAKEYHIK